MEDGAVVSDPHMAAVLVADETGAANLRGGVTGALERAVEIVGQADDQRRRRDFFQRIRAKGLCDARVVQQPGLAQPERQDVLHQRLPALALVGARPRYDLRRRGEDCIDHQSGCHAQCEPVQKVGPYRALVHEARQARGRRRRRFAGHVGEGDEQRQGTRALGMADRELQRRGRARREARDRGAPDAQRIEQAGMRVGLRLRRCVLWQGRAQVAEARHGDDAVTVARELRAELHALVEAAAGAVHQQHRWAGAYLSVFDRAACGGRDAADLADALRCELYVAGKPRVAKAERERRRAANGSEDVPPWRMGRGFHRTMNTECSVTATPSTPRARTSDSIGWVPGAAGAARTLIGTMRLVAAGTPTVGSPQTWMSGKPRTVTWKARACSVVFMICRR